MSGTAVTGAADGWCTVIETAAVLELAEFTCCRCGKPGADNFEDAAGLEAFLQPGLIPGRAQRIDPPFMLRQVDLAALAAFRPVHARCLRPPAPRPARGKPAYDVLRSVA